MGERHVGIFIDAENLFGGYGLQFSTIDIRVTLATIRSWLGELGLKGPHLVGRAYANWTDYRLRSMRKEIREQGLELVQVEGSSAKGGPDLTGPQARPVPKEQSEKNAADLHLAVDALAMAYDLPGMGVIVIVSGDGGLAPLVHHLHRLGRTVAGVSLESRDSVALKGACDHFLVLTPGAQKAPVAPVAGHQPTPGAAVPGADEFEKAVLAAGRTGLNGSHFVPLSYVQSDARKRLNVQSLEEVVGKGVQPKVVQALRKGRLATVMLPDEQQWLVMQESAVPGDARRYGATGGAVAPSDSVAPVFRGGVPALADVSTADADDDWEEVWHVEPTWSRDEEVHRVVVPVRPIE